MVEDPFVEDADYTTPIIKITPGATEYDPDIMATIDPETGEILEVEDAPAYSESIHSIAVWVGERRAAALARRAGLEAEKQAWIDRINKQYDPQIKAQGRLIDWVTKRYYGIFQEHVRQILRGRKERHIKIGLLTLKLVKTRPRLDIVDEAESIRVLRQMIRNYKALGTDDGLALADRLNQAIKIQRSLLKSQLTDDAIEDLERQNLLSRYPGGEDELKFE